MYVYIIQSGKTKKSPVKIGMSDDPEKRIKQLQTGNPQVLRIIISIKCNSRKRAFELERTLHRMLSRNNILNEWFFVKKKSLFETINRFANNPDLKQVTSFVDIFEKQSTEDIETEKVIAVLEKQVLEGTVESSIKSIRNKSKNKTNQLAIMEKKLTQRKREAKIFRSKLIELGFTGSIDELLGRK
ncbi:MAG TPA: GIY-YIG nuclease family protein [Flavobacteriales bacterium]|nr:GIY-YIG nuclease family protein [Methylococcaceae bacterium]HHZ95923.1 GIY-YIG nuclease family protein [Flavobacteriales bacterium]